MPTVASTKLISRDRKARLALTLRSPQAGVVGANPTRQHKDPLKGRSAAHLMDLCKDKDWIKLHRIPEGHSPHIRVKGEENVGPTSQEIPKKRPSPLGALRDLALGVRWKGLPASEQVKPICANRSPP